jgi:hypothetical protein
MTHVTSPTLPREALPANGQGTRGPGTNILRSGNR